ncbi:response regulator transcription factor [Peribacillus muralis]|uniref:response regulator transcription factor n=1 Tax=Peribacillus muralis TaxID=264697 RepID=UPI00070C8CD1|nr:response regulator transcription factor [Peribacillus muralis]MCK1994368.1 response regulator transcription factor [Peribacillus muralis]MCK2014847.1 response regulator transcription factor [Peribacillus muralis]
MDKRILIIEDEEKIARVLQLELNYEGYRTESAFNGKTGLEKAESEEWDLILLDVMLPELNGIEVLRRYRKKNASTPVILLTARDAVPDKVNGLDHGANDYVTKPFEIEELLARIRACFRTNVQKGQAEGNADELTVYDLKLNVGTRDILRQGKKIELTSREFDLLVYLLQNKNQVLSRDQILSHVWGYDFVGDTNVVDVYIRYLRKKVDYPFDLQLIHTYRGVGYSLKEPL